MAPTHLLSASHQLSLLEEHGLRETPRSAGVIADEPDIPLIVSVKRSDPVYNAHGYLTKVPVAAIEPFIEAFTQEGDLVVDPFAGSGMTGVAAAIRGRRAELSDISVLGRHIGTNYLNLVPPDRLTKSVSSAVDSARCRLDGIYEVECSSCGRAAELSRTVWTKVFECAHCKSRINYYGALEEAAWDKGALKCANCGSSVSPRKLRTIGEEPVLDTVRCSCSKNLVDQPPSGARLEDSWLHEFTWPDVRIDPERQMFQASALRKHGLESTASFFSTRNLVALAALHQEIAALDDEATQAKLRFVLTAILARASKRYQWSRARPLNAANQNYYVAPVFFEWNVFDLFVRKVAAVRRSDEAIRTALELVGNLKPDVRYETASAEHLNLADESVDYVFTDPPFGSNIFYSDMNLFHEAWLGSFTDQSREAVVDRSGKGEHRRSAARYEGLIRASLKECYRVLKPRRWLSLVFSNSSGEVWALVQRAIRDAGFEIETVSMLDKGQRSVKGLNSGSENVVTFDLVLSMRKVESQDGLPARPAPESFFGEALNREIEKGAHTASHIYLGIMRTFLRHHFDVSSLDLARVAAALRNVGYVPDERSGKLSRRA